MSPIRPRALVLLAAACVLASALSSGAAAAPSGPAPSGPAATPDPPGTSPSPPNPPADLRVSAVSARSITIAWTAPAPTTVSVAGYNIGWNQAYNDVVHLTTQGNVTSYTLDASWGVQPTGQYSFRVTTRDDLGHLSATAAAITVVTPASDTAPDRTPPSATTGLSASGSALSWATATDDVAVTGYNVYKFDGLYVSTLVATVAGTTYTTAATGMYYVRAADAAGNLGIASSPVTTTGGTTTPPPPGCSLSYRTTSQWAHGFVASITVRNLLATPIDGWTLTFHFGGDQRITTTWNATHTQSGADATLTAASWNRAIPAGASASAGLLGSFTTSNGAPTSASLNGAACTLS